MSREVTTMTLRTLFEKQVFVRLSEDHTAFICTTRWPLLSKIKRVSVDEEARDFAPQVDEPASITPEEVPVLRRGAVEQGRAHRSAELERRLYDS
jgi:hypothetical protein